MAKLGQRERAQLPDGAFAYIDSKGNRRLPIHDEAHVRNALSRFNQVRFESPEAREKAFRRVLKTAVEHGIAPVGFVAAQMDRARSAPPDLPAGPVSFLMSDIEGSTRLIDVLGDGYPPLLDEVRGLIAAAVDRHGGYEVDARADEYFAVFDTARDAAGAAASVQGEMRAGRWPAPVRLRIGLHSGSPARTETGYVGMAVNTTARLSSAAHGGQTVASADFVGQLEHPVAGDLAPRPLGPHALPGLPQPVKIFQIDFTTPGATFPPLRGAEAV